ncbi:Resolvase (fragment) [Hyella patelloides LEGE 07179]|uniref:Resolvase n=1 Tax=Hyella patelloides LEGE 07179 TaxID=945734 RepID=A0A563VRH3_9CYAN
MKLSSYAKKIGVSYKTAHRWWKAGQISGYQLPTGTIIITEEQNYAREKIACIYARVDTIAEKQQLEKQAIKLEKYVIAKKYQIYKVHQEIASGFSDRRNLLNQVLRDDNYNILIVEDCDKLAANGINYIKILLEKTGKKLEIVNFCLSS